MIKVENIKVYNIARAIYSARNPMNSWSKSDSDLDNDIVGPNDLDLAKRLYKAGTEHRKYLRQIFVSLDVTAPLYWWKEYDTYKVGTTSNSCSTMHKVHAKEFTLDDFSHEHLLEPCVEHLKETIKILNQCRDGYINYEEHMNDYLMEHPSGTFPGKKIIWWQMIQLLPSSYNQKRTLTLNYENVFNIIHQREHHKLDEWRTYVAELRKLPYVTDIAPMSE